MVGFNTIGWLFKNFRCGDSKLVLNMSEFDGIPQTIKITSPHFEDSRHLPEFCVITENVSPELNIDLSEVESVEEIKSFVVICQDVDVPLWFPVTHLLAHAVSAQIRTFEKGFFTGENEEKMLFKFGYAAFKLARYVGCGPIPGHGPHKYVFQVIGIDGEATAGLADLTERPDLNTATEIIKDHVIASGKITGTYERE